MILSYNRPNTIEASTTTEWWMNSRKFLKLHTATNRMQYRDYRDPNPTSILLLYNVPNTFYQMVLDIHMQHEEDTIFIVENLIYSWSFSLTLQQQCWLNDGWQEKWRKNWVVLCFHSNLQINRSITGFILCIHNMIWISSSPDNLDNGQKVIV